MFRCIGKSGKTSETRKKIVKRMVSGHREPPASAHNQHHHQFSAGAVITPPYTGHETRGKMEAPPPPALTNFILALVKRLDRASLNALETAIDWGNSGDTRCVLFDFGSASSSSEAASDDNNEPEEANKSSSESHETGGWVNYQATLAAAKRRVDFGGKCESMSPVHAACTAWRWPDLEANEPVKSLWFCRWANGCIQGRNRAKENVVCVNPYHWSRLAPSQSNIQDNPRIKDLIDKLKNNKFSDSLDDNETSSLNEDSRDSSVPVDDSSSSQPWCVLSYWELLHHVRNSWLPITTDTYHVFVSLHTGDGLSIPDLIQSSSTTSPLAVDTNATISTSCGGPYPPASTSPTPSSRFLLPSSSGGSESSPRCLRPHHPPLCGACGNLLTGGCGPGSSTGGSLSGASCNSGGPRISSYGPVLGQSERRQIQRCRDKIGHGLTLLRESILGNANSNAGVGRLWIYNRSDQPIFVTSPTLLSAESFDDGAVPRVVRLQPGHIMLAFDSTVFEAIEWARRSTAEDSGKRRSVYGRPTIPGDSMNRRVVHVSFGKGWGINYRRQDVTSCPCRLEIVLAGGGKRGSECSVPPDEA